MFAGELKCRWKLQKRGVSHSVSLDASKLLLNKTVRYPVKRQTFILKLGLHLFIVSHFKNNIFALFFDGQSIILSFVICKFERACFMRSVTIQVERLVVYEPSLLKNLRDVVSERVVVWP